ncbi:MAG: TetR/AcrR family transcriptional regulator [Bacteroidota bacterium]
MDTKNKILSAALELFVENGFHNTSTASICKKAGLSTGILFHYFETKEKLIFELFLKLKAEFYETALERIMINEHFKDSLKEIWIGLLRWGIDHQREFQFLMQYHNSPFMDEVHENRIISDLHQALAEFVKVGMEKNRIKSMPVDYIMNLTMNMIYANVNYLLKNPGEDTESFRELTWQVFWNTWKTE